MIPRTLLAAALAAALTLEASGQGLRQVGNDDFGMTIEEIHPTGSGLRVRVLIENLTSGREVFLHHEANQLNAQDFFYIYGARRNAGSKRDTYLLPILPQGTASADLFFPLEPGANPGLLVLGNPKPPFRQVAVALGSILKGETAEEPAGGLQAEVRPSQVAEPLRIELGASPPPARQAAAPRPAAPPRPTPAPVRQALEPTPAWSEPIAAPPSETLQISEAPPRDTRPQAAKSPRPQPAPGSASQAAKGTAPPPKHGGQAAKPAGPPPRPATTPKPIAVSPPARPAPKWTTPAGAPPQTGWIPVDDEVGDAAAKPQPKWTTPAGAPPQTNWIPVDDEPAPPGPPPVVPPKPKPAPPAAPKPAKPAVPAPPAATQKPKVVFLPNVPGDRILQIFTPPHISLGQNLVLRQGRSGSRGYGWSRIYAEHPNVQLAEIARAATYPHQVWSDGRTFLYLRWSEDQNGALVIQVAGDLIVNAQWASYEELLYWLGPGHVYPRLVYQGAR